MDKLVRNVVIVGSEGGFGRLFTQRLRAAGLRPAGVDVVGGALRPDDSQTVLAAADWVLLCAPESVALRWLARLDEVLPAGALVMDVCSVKSKIGAAARAHCLHCEYVSVHPMFSPDNADGPARNLIWVPERAAAKAAVVKTWFESQGLKVHDSSIEEHDRVTSLVQVVPHILLIAFAKLAVQQSVDSRRIEQFSTPVFEKLLAAARNVVAENPQLYHNIQTSNPHAQTVRRELLSVLAEVIATVEQSSDAELAALFEQLREV